MFDLFKTPAPNMPKPHYGVQEQRVSAVSYAVDKGETAWYPPVMAGASTLADIIMTAQCVRQTLEGLQRLSSDPYVDYLTRFYAEGLHRFGEHWRYADIVTVLVGLAGILKPRCYLEVGVRRGRSACAVGAAAPDCALVLCDMWMPNYAGIENPGPAFVTQELDRIGHRGRREFLTGDSHQLLPKYFADHPDLALDLITVDGDHSDQGAAQDLSDVLPRLAIGGAVVFDDVCHPAHPGLQAVWRELVINDSRFSSYTFDEVGYGVGFAVRKW